MSDERELAMKSLDALESWSVDRLASDHATIVRAYLLRSPAESTKAVVDDAPEKWEKWEPYKWPQIEMRYEPEPVASDSYWLMRWKFSPFMMADGPTREAAFAALLELTPTCVLAMADLPHADIREHAETARAIAVEARELVERLGEQFNGPPPTESALPTGSPSGVEEAEIAWSWVAYESEHGDSPDRFASMIRSAVRAEIRAARGRAT